MYTCYIFTCMFILLKTIYWMSSHQYLSIRFIRVSYHFPSYCCLRIISANICWGKLKLVSSFPQGIQNMVTMDHFPKLAKFPGLEYLTCLIQAVYNCFQLGPSFLKWAFITHSNILNYWDVCMSIYMCDKTRIVLRKYWLVYSNW